MTVNPFLQAAFLAAKTGVDPTKTLSGLPPFDIQKTGISPIPPQVDNIAPEAKTLKERLGNLADVAGAVQLPQRPTAPPPVSPSQLGGRLSPGIMQLLAQLLQGRPAPTIPSLGSLIAGR